MRGRFSRYFLSGAQRVLVPEPKHTVSTCSHDMDYSLESFQWNSSYFRLTEVLNQAKCQQQVGRMNC